LGHGFQAVARRWWLILIPILLDTLLWAGPHVSVYGLAQEAIQTFESELSGLSTQETDEWFDVFRGALIEAAAEYNALSALRVGMLGVPSLLIWGGARLGSPSPYEGLWVSFLRMIDMPDLLVPVSAADFVSLGTWEVESQGAWLLLVIGLSLVGTAIGCIYMTALWQGTEPEAERTHFWSRVAKLGRRFVLFWLLRALVLALLGIPFVFALALLGMLSPQVALLFASITIGLATWLSFYGTFVLASLVVNETSIWRAIWNSIGVVLRNFWSTLWLFILINLIGGGLMILWQQVSRGAWTVFAIVGNAYVGTSLIAASLLFYRDRYVRWQEAVADMLAQQEKQTT
jgi:hypothetical protein